MKKIYFICPLHPYRNIGGIETVVREVTKRISKKTKVEIITTDKNFSGEEIVKNIKEIYKNLRSDYYLI